MPSDRILDPRTGDPPPKDHRETEAMMKHVVIMTVATFVLVTAGTAQQPATGDQTLPKGFNQGSAPVKILVVFMGEEGKPTTINAQ
jgi:hypothetical protein